MKSFECFETVNKAELNSVLNRCFTEYASRFIMSDNLTDNGLNDMDCFFRSACIIVTCDTVVDAIYKLQNHILCCGKSFCYDLVLDWLNESLGHINNFMNESEDE